MTPLRAYLRPRKWEPVIGWWLFPAIMLSPFAWWGVFVAVDRLLTWIF